jgi:hypothetical protein
LTSALLDGADIACSPADATAGLQPKEQISMRGWMVTVSVVKDDDEIGHEMYAVAIGDPAQAVKSALNAAYGKAAVLNYLIDEGSMKTLRLKLGEVLKILDDKSDPLTTRAKRH